MKRHPTSPADTLGLMLNLLLLCCSATSAEEPKSVAQNDVVANSDADTDKLMDAVRKLLDEAPKTIKVPESWEGCVRYYSGISHSFHRILVHGQGDAARDSSVPISNGHRFYFDADGHLRLVVFCPPDVKAYITDYIFYHKKQPIARMSYSTEGLSYIDYVQYQDTLPVFSCRFLRDGQIVLQQRIGPDDPR